jgi:hypothetical protein
MRRMAIAAVVMLAGSLDRTVFAQTKSVALDLSGAGVKAVIQAPEGAKAKEFLSTMRVGAHSSHFYTTVKVGAKLHACFDTRGSGDYSKAEVDAMLAACRTLKAK